MARACATNPVALAIAAASLAVVVVWPKSYAMPAAPMPARISPWAIYDVFTVADGDGPVGIGEDGIEVDLEDLRVFPGNLGDLHETLHEGFLVHDGAAGGVDEVRAGFGSGEGVGVKQMFGRGG